MEWEACPSLIWRPRVPEPSAPARARTAPSSSPDSPSAHSPLPGETGDWQVHTDEHALQHDLETEVPVTMRRKCGQASAAPDLRSPREQRAAQADHRGCRGL